MTLTHLTLIDQSNFFFFFKLLLNLVFLILNTSLKSWYYHSSSCPPPSLATVKTGSSSMFPGTASNRKLSQASVLQHRQVGRITCTFPLIPKNPHRFSLEHSHSRPLTFIPLWSPNLILRLNKYVFKLQLVLLILQFIYLHKEYF